MEVCHGIVYAILIQNEQRPNTPRCRVYDPGFGFLKIGLAPSQEQVRIGEDAEDQIGAKDVMNLCQHCGFSVNYA